LIPLRKRARAVRIWGKVMKETAFRGQSLGKVGHARPTILDIARLAKVSPASVSNALTGRRKVADATRENVFAIADRLGYAPNLRARRLRTGRADAIAVFSPMPFAVAAGPSRLGFLMEIAAAAASAALENGMALILVPPMERGRAPFADLQMDGAIVVEPAADDPDVAALRGRGIPVVSIGRQVDARDVAFVDLQSEFTARQLLDHLREEGARRIALIVGAQRRNSYLEAEQAYQRFAAGCGMNPVVIRIDEGGGEALARETVLALMKRHSRIDALCVPVDVFAVGAVKAAHELGRRIPEDVKIATRYDGIRARECRPPLTAVTLHLDQLAVLAVKLLLNQIDGSGARGPVAGPRSELIIRTSSRPAPT
jgi:DNA-binding LacI/PurR family transcriptional regulator